MPRPLTARKYSRRLATTKAMRRISTARSRATSTRRFMTPCSTRNLRRSTSTKQDRRISRAACPSKCWPSRGPKTLSFGPMKPVGLTDPRTGHRPWAVLQLRQENRAATLYSMVGFQTRMKWGEQKRVFRLIPGLENAEFVRYGVIHRNTYIQVATGAGRHAPDAAATRTSSSPDRSPALRAMSSWRPRASWQAATPPGTC